MFNVIDTVKVSKGSEFIYVFNETEYFYIKQWWNSDVDILRYVEIYNKSDELVISIDIYIHTRLMRTQMIGNVMIICYYSSGNSYFIHWVDVVTQETGSKHNVSNDFLFTENEIIFTSLDGKHINKYSFRDDKNVKIDCSSIKELEENLGEGGDFYADGKRIVSCYGDLYILFSCVEEVHNLYGLEWKHIKEIITNRHLDVDHNNPSFFSDGTYCFVSMCGKQIHISSIDSSDITVAVTKNEIGWKIGENGMSIVNSYKDESHSTIWIKIDDTSYSTSSDEDDSSDSTSSDEEYIYILLSQDNRVKGAHKVVR